MPTGTRGHGFAILVRKALNWVAGGLRVNVAPATLVASDEVLAGIAVVAVVARIAGVGVDSLSAVPFVVGC